jgi:hypothetical protein
MSGVVSLDGDTERLRSEPNRRCGRNRGEHGCGHSRQPGGQFCRVRVGIENHLPHDFQPDGSQLELPCVSGIIHCGDRVQSDRQDLIACFSNRQVLEGHQDQADDREHNQDIQAYRSFDHELSIGR